MLLLELLYTIWQNLKSEVLNRVIIPLYHLAVYSNCQWYYYSCFRPPNKILKFRNGCCIRRALSSNQLHHMGILRKFYSNSDRTKLCWSRSARIRRKTASFCQDSDKRQLLFVQTQTKDSFLSLRLRQNTTFFGLDPDKELLLSVQSKKKHLPLVQIQTKLMSQKTAPFVQI